MNAEPVDYLSWFRMPRPATITARVPSLTNSFVNALIPAVPPTHDEVREALEILGMTDRVLCAYCGDTYTEWDHLRPLVVNRRPTGYISEIHNLVPACGKCNQSKGNKHWRSWMFSTAPLSPQTRAIAGLADRAERLAKYETWKAPTQLDIESIVSPAVISEHWRNLDRIVAMMQDAQATAVAIRGQIAATYRADPPPP